MRGMAMNQPAIIKDYCSCIEEGGRAVFTDRRVTPWRQAFPGKTGSGDKLRWLAGQAPLRNLNSACLLFPLTL